MGTRWTAWFGRSRTSAEVYRGSFRGELATFGRICEAEARLTG